MKCRRVGLLGFAGFLVTVVPILFLQASLLRQPCQPDPCSGGPLLGWFIAVLSSVFPMWVGYANVRDGWLLNPLAQARDADPKTRLAGVENLAESSSMFGAEGQRKSAKRLLKLLGDEDLAVRLAAIDSVPGIAESLSLT